MFVCKSHGRGNCGPGNRLVNPIDRSEVSVWRDGSKIMIIRQFFGSLVRERTALLDEAFRG